MPVTLNALSPTGDINTYIEMANKAGAGVVNPATFYNKQLLDTIRVDQDEFVYFRYAEAAPIQERADKLMLRRWAPLQAHTVPLLEGIPPKSDKGSVEKYEMDAHQYGRYMEFSDKVDFAVVDPVIAHYSAEYAIVAVETLDLLARETLFSIANRFHAGMAANFEALAIGSIPSMQDLRLVILSLKKQMVKPRSNGKFHVIASAEFYFDMISDPLVEKYMTINNTTKQMYDNGKLIPLFDMEFYETSQTPESSEYIKGGKRYRRMYRSNGAGGYEYSSIAEDAGFTTTVDGYVKDSRTGQDASYIPEQDIWDFDAWNTANKGGGADWYEFKVHHVLILGKDALLRTGLQGEDSAKVYVKPKGSSGVLDPIDQRQSIGFKINSVGFGSARLEAVVDYLCVPTQVNPV